MSYSLIPLQEHESLDQSCEQLQISEFRARKEREFGKQRVNVIFLLSGKYALQMTNISHGK